MPVRTPFIGETEKLESPVDPQICFWIKRCGNREDMIRSDMSSKVRYIPMGESLDQFISEKDFPAGSMRIQTILLALADWNIELEDEKTGQTRPAPITEENLLELTRPEELEALHAKVLEVNPMWGPGGSEARKKS